MDKIKRHPVTPEVFNQLEMHKAQPEFLPTKSLKPDDLYILPIAGSVEEWIFLGRVNTITLTPDGKYLCYNVRLLTVPECVTLGAQLMFRQYVHHLNESGAWQYIQPPDCRPVHQHS